MSLIDGGIVVALVVAFRSVARRPSEDGLPVSRCRNLLLLLAKAQVTLNSVERVSVNWERVRWRFSLLRPGRSLPVFGRRAWWCGGTRGWRCAGRVSRVPWFLR